MTEHMSIEEYKKRIKKKRGNKYGAVKEKHTSTQGFTRTYDSKAEAAHAAKLDMMLLAHEPLQRHLVKWEPQIRFKLPAGYAHFVDFKLTWSNGTVTYQEVKGRDLPLGRMKRRMVEWIYGIEIEVIKP